jgi:microcystin-dependent protein
MSTFVTKIVLITVLMMSFAGKSFADKEGFMGEVTLFSGDFSPRGHMFCKGQLLPIKNNEALYSILGTYYGGDGRTTFALPDLREAGKILGERGPQYIIQVEGIYPSRS